MPGEQEVSEEKEEQLEEQKGSGEENCRKVIVEERKHSGIGSNLDRFCQLFGGKVFVLK